MQGDRYRKGYRGRVPIAVAGQRNYYPGTLQGHDAAPGHAQHGCVCRMTMNSLDPTEANDYSCAYNADVCRPGWYCGHRQHAYMDTRACAERGIDRVVTDTGVRYVRGASKVQQAGQVVHTNLVVGGDATVAVNHDPGSDVADDDADMGLIQFEYSAEGEPTHELLSEGTAYPLYNDETLDDALDAVRDDENCGIEPPMFDFTIRHYCARRRQ